MSRDVIDFRSYSVSERRKLYRTRFGNILRLKIAQSGFSQKEFVNKVCWVAKKSGKKYIDKKHHSRGCTIHHSSFNEILMGRLARNFGDPDQPINLLWVTVTFMLYGAIKMPWNLTSWVF